MPISSKCGGVLPYRIFVFLLLLLSASCTPLGSTESGESSLARFFSSDFQNNNEKQEAENTTSGMISAPPSAQESLSHETSIKKKWEPIIYEGRGPVRSGQSRSDISHEKSKADIVINFNNTDIKEVAKSVLGDMLGVNYVVSPSLEGMVTINISHPVSRDEVVPILDAVFRMNGASISKEGGIYKIMPFAGVAQVGVPSSHMGTNVGIQVVPLRYISSAEMLKILQAASPSTAFIPVEAAKNTLMFSGSAEERSAVQDIVNTFDVDWLSATSFGVFPLLEANAADVAKELEEIIGKKTHNEDAQVKIMSVERLNAVLAISSQPELLKKVKIWVQKLDIRGEVLGQKIWIYPVQNGSAAALSDTLNKLLENYGAGSLSRSDGLLKSIPASTLSLPPVSSAQKKPIREAADFTTLTEGSLKIIGDDVTNLVIVFGSKEECQLVEAALKKLDIPPLQIMLEAAIAEVSLTDQLRYGTQYLFKNNNFTSVLTKAATPAVGPILPGFSAYVTSSGISSVLDLLQSVTKIRVISSPQLMVLNNQTAMLQVGDQVPIATQTSVSVATTGAPVVNSIQMKDTGIILKVTPRVNASGMVLLDITQEVSDVARTTSSNLDSPTIQQRKLVSTVAVRDGQTIALGGLIKEKYADGQDGIPVLSQIPIVGSLFGEVSEETHRTELLALITPRVIRTDGDMRTVTENLKHVMKEAYSREFGRKTGKK